MATHNRKRTAALVGLGIGLAIALAANLTYAIPKGPVVIGVSLVAPVILPLALYLRTAVETTTGWQVIAREVSIALVAGPAAAISYLHTYDLVLGAGEVWIIALLAPLSSDGLAGLATLVLHRQRKATPRGKGKTPDSRKPAAEAPAKRPAPEPPTVREAVTLREAGVTWALAHWDGGDLRPVDIRNGLLEAGRPCSKGEASKILAAAREARGDLVGVSIG